MTTPTPERAADPTPEALKAYQSFLRAGQTPLAFFAVLDRLAAELAASKAEVARLKEACERIASLEVTMGAASNLAAEALGWPVEIARLRSPKQTIR